MANRFYDPGVGRARRVGELFDGIARRYDVLNDLQSFGLHWRWKRRLVARARVGGGKRALDVCCGTGDVTLLMARAGAEVVGLDFSEGMLAVARGRLEGMGGQGLPQVKFVAGDALDLPFEAASFDAVTVAYGLRNLADLGRGLAEMARVTRPGGRLVALEFGKPANWVWRRLFFAYLGSAVPRLGRWFGGGAEAYGYILESLQHYPAQEGVVRLLEGLGLEGVRMENLMGGAMSIHVAEKRPGPS